MIATKVQRWTLFNRETNTLSHVTDHEFSELLKSNCLQLKGTKIEVTMNHPEPSRIQQTQKVWVDAIYKSEFLKG